MATPLTPPRDTDPDQMSAGDAGHGIPLGRWAGVPVSAHWSALFMLFLFTDLLAVSVLPAARPGQSTAGYWLAGFVTTLLFIGYVLAHELAHAVTARHYGVGIRSVTLWVLGGVSELTDEPPEPRADALIAAAGPASSLVLGAATYAVSGWFGSGLAGVSLAWLGLVNVMLAVINLLPGAPLDGGRLLRALLWRHYQDRARAAAAAATAGRGLGIALAVLGVLEVLAGALAGLWLVFVGWFISSSAWTEQAASRAEALRGMAARELMTPAGLVVPEWWTVEQFLSRLPTTGTEQAVFPLVDFAGQFTGVLTLRDLAAVPAGQRDERRLRDVPVRRRAQPLLVAPETDVLEVARVLPLHGGIAVVADDRRPVGLITSSELTRAAQLAGLRRQGTGSPTVGG